MKYEISIIAPDGSRITKPSKNQYGFAALYIASREKWEADARAAIRRGEPAPRITADTLEARRAFGVWRVASMCETEEAARAAGRERAKDRGVTQIVIAATKVSKA